MDQTVTTCQTEDRRGICKWLMWLLIVQIISMSYGILAKYIDFGAWSKWLNISIDATILFCIVMLWSKRKAYLVAVIFLSINFLCTLLWRLLFNNPDAFRYLYELRQMNNPMDILSIGYQVLEFGEICGMAAFFFEVVGHSKLVKSNNLRLSKGWIWLGIGILVVFAAMRVLNASITDMLEKGTLDVELYQKTVPLLSLPGRLIRIAYVVLLLLTGRELRKDSETI